MKHRIEVSPAGCREVKRTAASGAEYNCAETCLALYEQREALKAALLELARPCYGCARRATRRCSDGEVACDQCADTEIDLPHAAAIRLLEGR